MGRTKVQIRLHDGVSAAEDLKGFRLAQFGVCTLGLVGKNAGRRHAHNALYAQSTGSIEHIGVNDEVVVGHVELSRHILEQSTDLRGEVYDVSGPKCRKSSKTLVVSGGDGVNKARTTKMIGGACG
jgi:hypothetical protein